MRASLYLRLMTFTPEHCFDCFDFGRCEQAFLRGDKHLMDDRSRFFKARSYAYSIKNDLAVTLAVIDKSP